MTEQLEIFCSAQLADDRRVRPRLVIRQFDEPFRVLVDTPNLFHHLTCQRNSGGFGAPGADEQGDMRPLISYNVEANPGAGQHRHPTSMTPYPAERFAPMPSLTNTSWNSASR